MAGGMHFLVGVATNDLVILASDRASFAYGAVVADENNDKEHRLGDKLTMMLIGEDGDTAQFGGWVKRNLQLYSIRNGYGLSPDAAHHWIRRGISESLRSRDAYSVDVMLGGYDDTDNRAVLGMIDYLGNALVNQKYLFRGFSGRFCYAIMDREYKADMNEDEALAMVHKCLQEAKKRFVANIPSYKVIIIDKNGHRRLQDIKM